MANRLDELERLASLRERGALTQAEFEQQKRRLIGERSKSTTEIPRTSHATFIVAAILAVLLAAGVLLFVSNTNVRQAESPEAETSKPRAATQSVSVPAISNAESLKKAEAPSPAELYIRSERRPSDNAVKYSLTYDNCMNSGLAADGVNSEMLRCTVDEYERQDSRLNQIYQTKMGDLPEGAASQLRQRQRAWITTMKRKCEAENRDVEGGSMWPLVMSACRSFETIRRRIWLENLPA